MKVASGPDDPCQQVICMNAVVGIPASRLVCDLHLRGWARIVVYKTLMQIGLWAREHAKLTVWLCTFLIVRLAFPQCISEMNHGKIVGNPGYGWMTESTSYLLPWRTITQLRRRLKCEKSLSSLLPEWWMQLSRTVWWCYSMNLSDRCRTVMAGGANFDGNFCWSHNWCFYSWFPFITTGFWEATPQLNSQNVIIRGWTLVMVMWWYISALATLKLLRDCERGVSCIWTNNVHHSVRIYV